jgi:hypothetical protein
MFIIAKELTKTLWARCILKGLFTKVNVPILGIMILFMEAHKCVLIMMQIGLTIWMTTNPHQIMFFNWEMVLSIGRTKGKPLLLCHQKKLIIW